MFNKKLCLILSTLWLVLIIFLGSNDSISSARNTYNIVSTVISKYDVQDKSTAANIAAQKEQNTERKRMEFVNIVLRKSAHFSEYLILAFLISNTMFAFNYKGKGAVVYILFICLLTAIIDEFIQTFVHRSSSVGDVLIDFSGSNIGTALYYFFYYKIRKSEKLI